MGFRLQDKETLKYRRTWRVADGTMYRRVYGVPVDVIDASELPGEGEPLPGSSEAVLGPFIVAGGITFGQQRQDAQQEVVLTAMLLDSRATVNTYREIRRKLVDKDLTRYVYRTRGVSLTESDANAPEIGDTMSGTGLTIAPVCTGVAIDEDIYPGRYTFDATWFAPLVNAGGVSATTYKEIDRRRVRHSPTEIVYQTSGLADSSTAADIPEVGDTLTGTTAVCVARGLDEKTYPGKVVVSATWVQDLLASDFGA